MRESLHVAPPITDKPRLGFPKAAGKRLRHDGIGVELDCSIDGHTPGDRTIERDDLGLAIKVDQTRNRQP